MDERKQPHSKDDVPVIGDYSEAANARLRAESPRVSAPPPPAPPPLPGASPTSRSGAEQWRVDPSDVRRHARLRRQRERAGPLTRLFRYAVAAVALAVAVTVYWNLDTLRTVTLDLSALTSLFADSAGNGGGPSILGGEPETVVVEEGGVAGAAIATSLDELPQAADGAQAGDAPAAEQSAPSAAGSSTSVAVPPVATAPAEAPPRDALVDPPPVIPAAPPEPPPGPERFAFGLTTINVSEADASAAVVVLRSGDRRRASSVTWSTGDGTATAGVDYANLGMVVERFAAGEQNRTIHVPIVGDRNVEGPETFYVYLAASEGAAGESAARLEVVIDDDD